MKTILRHTITILLVITSNLVNAQYNIVNKTEKFLSKGKYANALRIINKALQKNTTNAAAYQAFALYYASSLNPEYHIDSAHYYNIDAISYFEKLDEKALQKLQKNHITSSYLQHFKIHLDSLAFQEKVNNPTVKNYNDYISIYTSSHLLDSATVLRNQLAFKEALRENTYHGYRAFMERYPEAVQIKEAKRRFEKLYFDESVKDGKLTSYVRFLEEHPQSVYRSVAEQQILTLSTIDHSLLSYLSFAEEFSSSIYSKIALDYAYHITKSIPNIKLDLPTYYDSLETNHIVSQQVLFPYYNNGYGFINSKGEIVIPVSYKKHSQCPHLFEDFIWLKNEVEDQLITKSGKVFWKEHLDQIKDLGVGLLSVSKDERYGLIHKSGKVILPMIYDDLQIINQQYIAYRENRFWGIASALGRKLTKPIYQSILGINGFILLQQQGNWAVINSKKIIETLDTPLQLSFIYDDYGVYDNDHLIVFQDDKVNIISKELALKIPDSTTDITIGNEVLITENNESYHLIDPALFEVLATSKHPILSNEAGVFYQLDNQWTIWENRQPTKLNCDSLSLLGDHFIKCYQADSVRFLPNIKTQFPKNTIFTNLQQPNETYLLIKNQKYISLMDSKGHSQLLEDYDKVTLAGDSLLIVQQGQLKGLINIKGEKITGIDYNAIQRYDSITFTLLKGSKFGIYNVSNNTLIKPNYSERIVSYDESLYIANQNNLYGLIDHEGRIILPFEFDQIQYWNSTSALVKKEYQWIIYNIQDNQPIIDKISQYTKLNATENLQIMRIFKENGFGILHNKKGELIPPSFYNVYQVQHQNTMLYIAEKYIEEADFYVVIYYDIDGNIVFKHAMEAKHYQMVNCENP